MEENFSLPNSFINESVISPIKNKPTTSLCVLLPYCFSNFLIPHVSLCLHGPFDNPHAPVLFPQAYKCYIKDISYENTALTNGTSLIHASLALLNLSFKFLPVLPINLINTEHLHITK